MAWADAPGQTLPRLQTYGPAGCPPDRIRSESLADGQDRDFNDQEGIRWNAALETLFSVTEVGCYAKPTRTANTHPVDTVEKAGKHLLPVDP